MLIRFTVANFRSFKEKNTFSMELTGLKQYSESNAFHSDGLNPKEKLLKSAIVYGANASGKSNLVRALSVMRRIVLKGGIEDETTKFLIEPFRLADDMMEEPLSFEIEFIYNKHRYRYGFACKSSAVTAEWLYVKKQRMTLLFAREGNDFVEKSSTFEELTAWEKVISNTDLTLPSESLFLATAAKMFKGVYCTEVGRWFRDQLCILDANTYQHFMGRSFERLQKGDSLNPFVQFLHKADLGIHGLRHEINDIPVEDESARKSMRVQVSTEHIVNGKSYFLDLFLNESDGTQKIFALAGVLLDVLKNGMTLICDELDAQLHPLLLKHLIELFHTGNSTGAQLIATAHSPSMLTENNFRRDQIWFVDKLADGGSHLVSLADFKHIRGNYHRIVQDYLHGCFGGVPYIQDLEVN